MKALHYLFIASFIGYAYMAAVVLPAASARIAAVAANPECAKPFDLYMTGFSAQEAADNLVCLGQDGISVYRAIELREDVIYPIIYTIFLGLGIFIWAGYCTKQKWLAVLLAFFPVAAMLSDYVENASIISLLDQYGQAEIDGNTVKKASFFNQMKWFFAFTSMALFAFFGIWALIKRLSQKRKVA
jgi:hypothetical protein